MSYSFKVGFIIAYVEYYNECSYNRVAESITVSDIYKNSQKRTSKEISANPKLTIIIYSYNKITMSSELIFLITFFH